MTAHICVKCGHMLLIHSSTDCKMPVKLSKDDSLNRICHVILLTIYFSKYKERLEPTFEHLSKLT
jgi:hypothetical protein